MNLQKVQWAERRSYKSGRKNEPIQFHIDALCNSNKIDLLLGYFSSSSINVLSLGFASFFHKGGKIRFVINDVLSQNDQEAINKGLNSINTPIDFSNISKLKESLDDRGVHFFECFSWLIAHNKIEFVIIRPKGQQGIAHYKSGIISDGTNEVGFKASCNFTAHGLLQNLEELECFLSWEDNRSKFFIEEQKEYFNQIFSKQADFVEYVNIEDVKHAISQEFQEKSIDELLKQEKKLLEKESKNPQLALSIENALEHFYNLESMPRFPYPSGPREYQKKAYEEWVKNGYQGVFAMATGTGKTITSLNCLLNIFNDTGVYRAIIVAPTIALVKQWKKECEKFNFKNIIIVSSKKKWQENLAFFSTASKLTTTSYIIIVTYASFSKPKFQQVFHQLPENLVFIADEAHNIGSKNIRPLLDSVHLSKRIGLSATPNRQYDDAGNNKIETFFNDRAPYIVSYSMEMALQKGWLSNYVYYPHIVRLTHDEMEEYKRISAQLAKMGIFDFKTGTFRSTPAIEMKLLERKRIIHKAVNKLDSFKLILKEEFSKRGNLKYTLVYVPEGMEPDYSKEDELREEDIPLIDKYTKAVSEIDDWIMTKKFTSQSDNRDKLLKDFEKGDIDVLTSMKCLDEGVDVPRSELAIFCSSTGNPRQFIQRRGRVLRLHQDKTYATIHDLVVIPDVLDDNSFEMEKGLLKKELRRVVDFANLALNKADTYERFESILDYYNLTLNNL